MVVLHHKSNCISYSVLLRFQYFPLLQKLQQINFFQPWQKQKSLSSHGKNQVNMHFLWKSNSSSRWKFVPFNSSKKKEKFEKNLNFAYPNEVQIILQNQKKAWDTWGYILTDLISSFSRLVIPHLSWTG